VNFSGGDYAGVNPNYFSAPVNDYSQKWDYVSPVNDYDFSQTPEAYGGGNWNFDNVNFEDPAFNTSYRESPQFTDFQEDQWYTPWNESKNQDAGQWWTDTTKDWGLNSGINGDTGYVIPDTQKIVEIPNWKESNQQPFYTGGGYPMSDIPGTVGAENFGRWSNNYPPDKTVIGSSPKPVWNDGLWIAPGSGSLSDISGSNGYNNMVRFEFSDAAGKLGIPSSKTVVSPPNFARFSSENRGQYEVKPELEILPKMSSMTTTPLADIKYLDASKTELPYNFERDFKFQLPWNPTGEAKNDWVSGLKNVDWSGSGGVVLTNPKTGFSDPMYTRDIAVAPDINDDWTTAALKRTVSAGLPNTV
jgi:hypothetical protein